MYLRWCVFLKLYVVTVDIGHWVIFALAIEFISSVCCTFASTSSSPVVASSIFASNPEINSCFRWSYMWRSFKVAMASPVSGCALSRISLKFCCNFVRCALNPHLDVMCFLISAILEPIAGPKNVAATVEPIATPKMLQGYDSIVSIPVKAPKMWLVKYSMPLMIGRVGEDPRSKYLMLIPQSHLILIIRILQSSSSTTLNSLQSNL